MLRCIAIDDEPLALQLIQSYVEKIEGVQLEGTFTDALLAQQYLEQNTVDCLFLDIQMPDINGMEFYKSLQQPPAVIFTTAYSNYAVEGFNVNADDYLVKPFDFERFFTAVHRVLKRVTLHNKSLGQQDYLLVKHNYVWTKIAYASILYIEALDDYIKIHTVNQVYLVHSSMKSVGEKLPREQFARIHRSFIVRVDAVDAWSKNTLVISGQELSISASYQKGILEMLNNKNT